MIRIEKTSISNMLFYIAYSLYLGYNLFISTFYAVNIQNIGNVVIAICFFLLLMKELYRFKIGYKDLIIGIIFLGIAFIFYRYLGYNRALLPILLYSARNVDVKKILRISYWMSLVVLLFVIISSKMGIIENFIEYGEREREYLGFRYSLFPASVVCNIVFIKIYLDKEEISWKNIIFLTALSTYTYILTDSRLTFGLECVAIVIAVLLKKYSKLRKIFINKYMILSYIVSGIISYYFTISYDYLSSWQAALNEFLGKRLSLGYDALNFYGYNLLGKKLELIGNGLNIQGERNTSSTYDYVDNLYVQLLLRTGILFLIFFIVGMTYVLYKTYIQKDVYLLIILSLLALHGIIDDLILQVQYNSFWFVIPAVVYGMLEKKEEKI